MLLVSCRQKDTIDSKKTDEQSVQKIVGNWLSANGEFYTISSDNRTISFSETSKE